MNNKIKKTKLSNKKSQNENLSYEKKNFEDLFNNLQPQEYKIDKNIRVIGKFKNYFIHAWNKIVKGKLITTAFIKFENSLKIQFRMKNLVLQQIFKLNGYTKVGFFIIKKGQIMYRMCQNIINHKSQVIILESVISSNDSIINKIIQKYYVFFYPYLFEMNLSQYYYMIGMNSQYKYVQLLEQQIKNHLKDCSKLNQEIVDSQIFGQPNIQEIFIHGDKCVVKNKDFPAKFNFINAQSDIYQATFLSIEHDKYIDILENTKSPFLQTVYKYNEDYFREKNSNISSLHELILNNKPLSLLRRLQIVSDVCEGIKSFQNHQREDLMESQKLQKNIDNQKNEYLQIKTINPHTIMITPQLSSFILIWPNKNDNLDQNFQYKENNQHVEFNKLEKHTMYSIGKLLCLLFSSKNFQIEGPNLFIESIKNLIFLCQNNSNITIQNVVNVLNLLQKYLDQFD